MQKKSENANQVDSFNWHLRVVYFTTISGHFFANHINTFYKTEVQTVILNEIIAPDFQKVGSISQIRTEKSLGRGRIKFKIKCSENGGKKNKLM